jgi:hypothetical protein
MRRNNLVAAVWSCNTSRCNSFSSLPITKNQLLRNVDDDSAIGGGPQSIFDMFVTHLRGVN